MELKAKYGLACATVLMSTSIAFALPKASEIYPTMGLGYNIGNTMEVPGNPTTWGNDFPTAEYVKAIKDAGFGTVRIPCAWDSHASNGTINKGWLDSVKTVVDYVIDNGMYAILNSHWDEGWLEDHVFDGQGYDQTGYVSSDAATVAAKQESYWKQIATQFADYDEHLIFASANEPGVNDPWKNNVNNPVGDFTSDNGQWAFDETRMKVLKMFHEACIKGVRSTGGNNATRTIVVQAPRTEIDKSPLLANNYPEDPAGLGYTMAEIHFYPYQLTLMNNDESWGKVFYYWEDITSGDADHTCTGETLGSKKSIDSKFDLLKTNFVSKNIPVIIGEMGSKKRTDALVGDDLKKHLEARAAWYGYTVKSAKEHGIVPCVWDTGDEGPGNFTIIRRQKKFGSDLGAIVDVETLNAMREAFGAASLEGNTIDDKVQESISTDDKALHITYKTITSDSSEAGTMRINITKDADWSEYVAISFDMRIDGESAGPCTDASREGCGESGWASVSLFNMSGSWAWKEVSLGNVSDLSTFKNHKVEFGTNEGQLEFADKSNVLTIGINVYGTQFIGDMYLDNMVLWKADGTTDTVSNFNKSLPELAGIASGVLVMANETGSWGESGSSNTGENKPIQNNDQTGIVALKNLNKGFSVFAKNGSVQVKLASSEKATIILMSGLGQVIAKQKVNAAHEATLKTGFRGVSYVVVKQGSQKFITKVNLK